MEFKPQPGDALLGIDLQPTFMPGGALPVPEGDKIVRPIAELMSQFEHVILTRDHHPKGHISFASSHEGKKPFETIRLYGKDQMLYEDHGVWGTQEAEIHPDIPKDLAHVILRKGTNRVIDSKSAFEEDVGPDGRRKSTGLMGMLCERNVRRIVLCGLAGEICVYESALSIGQTIPAVVLWDLIKFVNPDVRKDYELLYRKANVIPV